MMTDVFVDTGYAIALASHRDQYHERASAWATELGGDAAQLVTTGAILLEIGNALSKRRYRVAAVRLLDALSQDPNVRIVPISDDLYRRALDLFRDRLDKDWSLTDCVSFVVMRELGLTRALSSDEHFMQAGFRALLREAPTAELVMFGCCLHHAAPQPMAPCVAEAAVAEHHGGRS